MALSTVLSVAGLFAQSGVAILIAVVFAGLMVTLVPTPSVTANAKTDTVSEFVHVQQIVKQRCATCHAEVPTQPGFTVAPKGLLLESAAQITANAAKINEQVVVTRTMPIGNLTQMTEAERAVVAAWIAAGASGK